MDRINELNAVFEKAVKEAYEKGLVDGSKTVAQLADKPVETVLAMSRGVILRKVERKFKVGDYVRFYDDHHRTKSGCFYEIVNSKGLYIAEDGYKGFHIHGWGTLYKYDIYEVAFGERERIKSPNQQRYETIQRAREFVEREVEFYSGFQIQFVVNDEKRTVAALIHGVYTKIIHYRGIAKCTPGDVFNADIGKAIALARALEIDIPVEFLKAIQPDEVVVGMRVDIKGNFFPYEAIVVVEGGSRNALDNIRKNPERLRTIIDDTNAIYEGDAHE